MQTLSTLLALCKQNPLMTGGFPSQRTNDAAFVSFIFVLFYDGINKLLNKRLSYCWFEMPWHLNNITVMARQTPNEVLTVMSYGVSSVIALMDMGHVTWQPLLVLLSWYPTMLSSLCNSFEDGAPVDGIYGCPISNELQWLELGIVHQDSSLTFSNAH